VLVSKPRLRSPEGSNVSGSRREVASSSPVCDFFSAADRPVLPLSFGMDPGRGCPMFDVASSYVDSRNGFWVCAFDANDELIHTQAVRMLDLSGITLGTHLDDHRHKYITPDTTPDPDKTFPDYA
jgi:hypothetical protein